eukprot:c8908_g1_i1.p1 GENE.c8908_g1_i1~~c8908_g1_i1.p1  ORF type:complete len:123 (-),score=22.70 c8908_g1_i1:35-403(-)
MGVRDCFIPVTMSRPAFKNFKAARAANLLRQPAVTLSGVKSVQVITSKLGPGNAGGRLFWKNVSPSLKLNNPEVRFAAQNVADKDVAPRVEVEFDNGKKSNLGIAGLSVDAILNLLKREVGT